MSCLRQLRGSGVCKINARQLRGRFSKERRPPAPLDFNVCLKRRARGGAVPGTHGDERGRKQKRAFILQDQNTPFRPHTTLKSGGPGGAASEETNLRSADRKTCSGQATKCRAFFFANTGGDFPSSILISFPRRGFGWFQRFVSECFAHGAQSATMLSQNIRLSSAPAVSSAPRGAKVRAPPKPPASPSSGAHGHPRASGDYIAIKCAPASRPDENHPAETGEPAPSKRCQPVTRPCLNQTGAGRS